MPSFGQDVYVRAGDTCTITVTVTDGDSGGYKNLTGASIHWVAYSSSGVVLSKSVGSGITVTSATGGVFTISLSASDLALAAGQYGCEAEVTDSGGQICAVLSGVLYVTAAHA